MNKYIGGALLVLVVFVGVVPALLSRNNAENNSATEGVEKIDVVLHKSPTCGCCAVYGTYLGRLGYEIETRNTNDIDGIKEGLGVPYELGSCHTMEIGGYVVEGHVPEEVISKLFSEKPDIKGIGMAGMPSGSPGMPGPKTEDYVVYEISHDGSVGDIFLTL